MKTMTQNVRRMMRNLVVVLALGFVLVPVTPLECADKITLKNGEVYEGRVIGVSDRRYLLSIDTDGVRIPISFFKDEVEKVDFDRKTALEQIPYLKEVESLKVPTDKEQYEFSLYKKGQLEGGQQYFMDAEIQEVLDKGEYDYYQKFTDATTRHAPRLVAVDNLYQNLPSATREDFIAARQSLDLLYFEINELSVPSLFRESHEAYLQFLKSTYLVFTALERGLLEEAAEQMRIAEQSKRYSLVSFRQAVLARKSEAALKKPQETPDVSSSQAQGAEP